MAAALFPPLFIDPTTYAEIAMSVLAAGFLGWHALRMIGRHEVRLPKGLLASLAAFVGYLALRSLFAPEPMVAFGGAWSSDGTVFTAAVVAVGLLGLWGWRPAGEVGRGAEIVSLLIVVTLLAAASALAAWAWGSTDPSGGPASGFTANSQLQLQLLTCGLTACLAWVSLRRKDLTHVLIALMLGATIIVGMLLGRSAVAVPSLGLGAGYAILMHASTRRLSSRMFAALSTAVIAISGAALVAALAIPGLSSRLIPLLDRIGSGRGAMWGSSVQTIAQSPVFGRGLGHSSVLTVWNVSGPQFDYAVTGDPHSILLTLASGGGAVAIVLGLVVLYFLQVSLGDTVRTAPAEQRLFVLIVVAGAVSIFVLSQFTFVFSLAWMLIAVLLGLVLARGSWTLKPRTPRLMDTTAIGAGIAIAAVLVALVWVTIPGRAGSTRSMMANLSASPPDALNAQLLHIRHPWDLVPAELASLTIESWSSGPPAQSTTLRRAYDGKMAIVADSMTGDARMVAASLRVWSTDMKAGAVDFDALDRIVEAGITANPGSGMWAAAGCSFANHYGDKVRAVRYATLLRENPEWWRQAEGYTDAETLKVITELAGR